MNARLPRRRLVAAAVALAALPLALTAPGSDAASRKAVAHGANGKSAKAKYLATPKMFRLGHGTGEPTLGIDKKGGVFITASSGCVTSCTGSDEMVETVAPGGRAVFRTVDKGKTWQDVTPGLDGGISPHVYSLDPYLFVDETADGNRIFDVDLTVWCAMLSFSDDKGANWTTNPASCGEPVNDHQTVFSGKPVTSTTIGYPNLIYYCWNLPDVTTRCTKSLNGGLVFIPTGQVATLPCSGLNGHGVTDFRGWIYLPHGANCGSPYLSISKDEGATWKAIKVDDELGSSGDPSVAVDKNGNIYYLWVAREDRLPRLVVSRNGGTTWSKPIKVASRNVEATNLATIDVGKPGRAAIAYYGTTGDPGDAQTGWNGYIVSAIDLLTSKPTFYTGTINPPSQPLKVNGCGPGRCGRVLDFIDIEIAPDGSPWGAYVDACATACEKSRKESIHDNEGVVGTLVGGPKLR